MSPKESVNESNDGLNEQVGGSEGTPNQNSLTKDTLAPENLGPASQTASAIQGNSDVSSEDPLSALAGQPSKSPGTIVPPQAPSQNEAKAASLAKFSQHFSNELASKLGEPSAAEWTLFGEINSLQLRNSSGLQVELVYDLEAESPVQFAWMSFPVEGVRFIAVPNVFYSKLEAFQGGYFVDFVATDLVIGDVGGNMGNLASNESDLSKAAIFARLFLDSEQKVYLTDLKLEPRQENS